PCRLPPRRRKGTMQRTQWNEDDELACDIPAGFPGSPGYVFRVIEGNRPEGLRLAGSSASLYRVRYPERSSQNTPASEPGQSAPFLPPHYVNSARAPTAPASARLPPACPTGDRDRRGAVRCR